MFKKILLPLSVILSILGATSFVFGYNLVFNGDIHLDKKLSSNIYLDSHTLNSTVLGFSSFGDISGAQVHSTCDVTSQFLESDGGIYFFKVNFLDDCENPNLVLRKGEDIYLSASTKLNFVTQADLFNILTDYSTSDLEDFQNSLQRDITANSMYKDYNGKGLGKYYNYLVKQRKYDESIYKKEVVDSILERRTQKYISPVP